MKQRLAITLCLIMMVVACVAAKKFVLVIDPGHGGHDAGAVGAFSKEKDINLRTALAFGRYVERNCPDVKVVYTRKTDVFVALHERANIANRHHADAFISVHTNSLPAGRIARGFETYTMGMRRSDEKLSAAQRENSVITIEKDYQEHYAGYDPNSPESAIMFEFIHDSNMAQSVELAKSIQRSVCRTTGRPDKGVKQDVFLVLRETSMPACLIELGFISTPDEERLLNNDAETDRMAYAIYAAFVKYKDKNNAIVVPYKEPQVSVPQEKPVQTPTTDAPVFKVQFMTSPRVLAANASQFKGIRDATYYRDGSTIKYTVGECASFSDAMKLRKEIADRFPDAFVVAFRNNQRMDINEARRMAGKE